MTQITLDLSLELEAQLRAEAAKQGLAPQRYILETLHNRLAAASRQLSICPQQKPISSSASISASPPKCGTSTTF